MIYPRRPRHCRKPPMSKNILQVDLAGKRREFLLLASLGSRVISDSCQKQLWVPFCGAYEDYKAYASAVHEIKMAR